MNSNPVKYPLVSVITVTFNAATFIEQTIQSVLSQTYPFIEYIIIDGGSSDGTVEIIRNYEAHIAYWHSRPDRGLAHAFNLGLAQAHGEWIIYLNADDFFLNNSVVEQMVPHLMAVKEADVIFGRVMSVARTQNAVPLPLAKIYYGKSWRWQEMRWQTTIPHQAAFTNRNYFTKVGNFDETLRIVIDYEFYLRGGRQLKAHFVPINISAMRVGGISGNDQVRLCREYRQVQIRKGSSPAIFCWLNFFYKIGWYYSVHVLHKLLDRYAAKLHFKNRMSGNLMNNYNLNCEDI